jgi:flavin reductase (DIM6/NTAB) family NADH-FMN oxidoreductase RutF
MKTIDFATQSAGENYSLLSNLVVPRPIALVSTISADGVPNLAPFSFFMIGGANPPSLMFSPVIANNQAEKDTLRNIRETGEFVVNLVHFDIRDGMNQASGNHAPDVSEWEVAGLTPLPSDRVKPARVMESHVQFECKLFAIVNHGTAPGAGRYVIGEILLAHVEQESDFQPISRLGGPDYLDLASGERFSLDRPKI